MSEFFTWLGSIATILAFFWIQLKIDQLTISWEHAALFLISLLGEVYVIWLLNSPTV